MTNTSLVTLTFLLRSKYCTTTTGMMQLKLFIEMPLDKLSRGPTGLGHERMYAGNGC
jgi:hypothetical protein